MDPTKVVNIVKHTIQIENAITLKWELLFAEKSERVSTISILIPVQ